MPLPSTNILLDSDILTVLRKILTDCDSSFCECVQNLREMVRENFET